MRSTIKKFILGILLTGVLFVPGFNAEPVTMAQDEEFPVIRMSTRSEYVDIVYSFGDFDEKYGVEVEPIPLRSGPDVIEAVVGGVVDIGSIGHIPLVSLMANDPNVVVVATRESTEGDSYKLIVKEDSDVESLEDLIGKPIATRTGSGSYDAFSNYAEAHGYSIDDFEILNTDPASLVAALEAGSVEAAIWFPPTTSIMIVNGFGRELDNFHGMVFAHAHWVVNRDFLEDNPEAVARFLAGVMDAQDLLENDPEEAAQILSDGFAERGRDLPPEVFFLGLDDFDFCYELQDRHLENFPVLFEGLVEAGNLSGDAPDFSSYIDDSYLEEAQALREASSDELMPSACEQPEEDRDE